MFPHAPLEVLRLEVLAEDLCLGPAGERDQLRHADLARLLLQRHPGLGERQAREITEEALAARAGPLESLAILAGALLASRSKGPSMQQDATLRWLRGLMDEDLLLAAWAARQSTLDGRWLAMDPPSPDLDASLRGLLEKPLAETHLHLWGAAPRSGVWLPAMLGLVSLRDLAQVATGAQNEEHGQSHRPQSRIEAWIRRLLEAAILRLWLASALANWTKDHPFRKVLGLAKCGELLDVDRLHWPSDWQHLSLPQLVQLHRRGLATLGRADLRSHPGGPPIPGCPLWLDAGFEIPYVDPLSQAAELTLQLSGPAECQALGERYLLASSLRSTGPQQRSQLGPQRQQALRQHLVRYLRLKNSFLRHFLHQPGTRGLERFLRQFGRRWVQPRPGPQPRGQWHRATEVWRLILERYQTRCVVRRWLAAATFGQLPENLRPSGLPTHGRISGAVALSQHQLTEQQRKLELRVSPDLGPDLRRYLHARVLGMEDALRPLSSPAGMDGQPNQSLPRLRVGVIYHLPKRRHTSARQYRETTNKVVALLRGYPELRTLVVGLDAAGDELSAPGARFAQAFRAAREATRRPLADREGPELPLRLGRTFHVGEDFRDLLSGLREVDLACSLLQLDPGDRLGHALALGLDPSAWYREHPRPVVRLADALIDRTWAFCRLYREDDAECREVADWIASQTDFFEVEGARRRFEEWMGGAGDFELENLTRSLAREANLGHPAWSRLPGSEQARGTFNSRSAVSRQGDSDSPSSGGGSPHHRQPSFCGAFLAKDRLVDSGTGESWAQTVALLQRLVRRDLARAGVVVEINPTSNLLLAGLSCFGEHPVFAIHPPHLANTEEPRLPVSVSTDDPGIFQISLAEEYTALQGAALDLGLGRQQVLSWLDGLRQASWESSFLRGECPHGQAFLSYLSAVADRARAPAGC